MKNKKEKLYNAIVNKYNLYINARQVFGEEHFLTAKYFQEMNGLKEAFEVVFGISDTDYLISICEEVIV